MARTRWRTLCPESLSTVSVSRSVDYEALAQAQIDANLSSARLPPSCSSFPLPEASHTLLCDTSAGEPPPVVPPAFRRTILEALHGLAHPGVKASVTLIASWFSWRRMYVLGLDCAWPAREPKFTNTPKPPSLPFPFPMPASHTFDVDLVGPLPLSLGQRYLLTCVDRFTFWPVAIPDITAYA